MDCVRRRCLRAIGCEKFSLLTESHNFADQAGVMLDESQKLALTGLLIGEGKAELARHLGLQIASQPVLRASRQQVEKAPDARQASGGCRNLSESCGAADRLAAAELGQPTQTLYVAQGPGAGFEIGLARRMCGTGVVPAARFRQ